MSHPDGLPDLFLDRSLGRVRVPPLLRAAGLRLVTLSERYGIPADEIVADHQWLAEAGQRGEAVFMKDTRIRYQPAEKAAITEHSIRCFCLRSVAVGSALGVRTDSFEMCRSQLSEDLHPLDHLFRAVLVRRPIQSHEGAEERPVRKHDGNPDVRRRTHVLRCRQYGEFSIGVHVGTDERGYGTGDVLTRRGREGNGEPSRYLQGGLRVLNGMNAEFRPDRTDLAD